MDQDPTPDPTPAPAPAPAQTLAQEVGAGLKATRISRGYSLESVSQHTRISRRFLEALESGRFEDLPAPVYLRSFLAGYCEYLELELRPLWDKLHPAPIASAPAGKALPGSVPAAVQAVPDAARLAGSPAPKGRDRARPAAPAQGPVGIPLEASPYIRAVISASGALALSLALTLGLVWWATGGRHPGPDSEDSLRTAKALPDWQVMPRPARPTIEPRLALASRQDTWVGVKADGAVLFAGRLPKNARQEFQAHKQIVLRASAPEDLILTLNGAPYRLPRPDDDGDYRIESP